MTRPVGRRRLPALALALLCLVARCGGEAAAGRRALQAHSVGLVAPDTAARRFGLPRRLAQAAEGEEESSALELDSSLFDEEEDSSGKDELLGDRDSGALLDRLLEASPALADGDAAGVPGGGGGSSDGEDGEDSEQLLSSDEDGDGLFDDEEEDDGFDWSSDLRLWGDDEEDEEDDGASAWLDNSLLSDDELYFDFWADDDELPDLGAPQA